MVDARGHTCLTVTRDRQYVPAMTPTLVTADQLEHLRLPDKHVELVKGVLIVKEPAGYRHGAVAARLAKVLMDYADAQDLGQVVAAETGFTLATDPIPCGRPTPRSSVASGSRTRRPLDLHGLPPISSSRSSHPTTGRVRSWRRSQTG